MLKCPELARKRAGNERLMLKAAGSCDESNSTTRMREAGFAEMQLLLDLQVQADILLAMHIHARAAPTALAARLLPDGETCACNCGRETAQYIYLYGTSKCPCRIGTVHVLYHTGGRNYLYSYSLAPPLIKVERPPPERASRPAGSA